MSLTKRKYTYVDFTSEPTPVGVISSTAATKAVSTVVATGADTTATAYTLTGGKRLEVYHDGATTVAGPTLGATGWTYPIASGAFAAQIGEGSLQPGHKSFTVGTDPAFFVRYKFINTTIAKNKALAVGFRKDGNYVVAVSVANLQAAYDDKYVLGTVDAGANWTAETSLAGVDTQKAVTAPASPMVNGITYDVKVMVSAAGVVSATVNGSAVTGAAASYTFANGTVVVPVAFLLNITQGAANDAVWVEYECGYVD